MPKNIRAKRLPRKAPSELASQAARGTRLLQREMSRVCDWKPEEVCARPWDGQLQREMSRVCDWKLPVTGVIASWAMVAEGNESRVRLEAVELYADHEAIMGLQREMSRVCDWKKAPVIVAAPSTVSCRGK